MAKLRFCGCGHVILHQGQSKRALAVLMPASRPALYTRLNAKTTTVAIITKDGPVLRTKSRNLQSAVILGLQRGHWSEAECYARQGPNPNGRRPWGPGSQFAVPASEPSPTSTTASGCSGTTPEYIPSADVTRTLSPLRHGHTSAAYSIAARTWSSGSVANVVA